MRKLLLACFLSFGIVSKAQTNLYVDSSVSASGAGTSWSSAYKTLNEALLVANFTSSSTKFEINVAKGTYFPPGVASATNRDSTFLFLRGGIKLFGGFPTGGGTRSIATNPVVLSGEIGSSSSADNSYHVIVIPNIPATADSIVIDGFNVTGGNANGTGGVSMNGYLMRRVDGAGLYVDNCKNRIIVSNCNFSGNIASKGYGGGICVYNSWPYTTLSLSVLQCNITSNSAICGGGLYHQGRIEMYRSTFRSNSAFSGGGVYSNSPAVTQIQGCIFSGNTASSSGGGMNSQWADTLAQITNCLFSGNRAGAGGGGALCDSMSGPKIDNCTFAGDTSVGGNGNGILNIDIYGYSKPSLIVNSILWDGVGKSLVNVGPTTTSTVYYCTVQGGVGGPGNLFSDPLFVSPLPGTSAPNTGGNYRLLSCSPAINSGLTYGTYVGSFDVDGRARLSGSALDRGAYEMQSPTTPVATVKINASKGSTICSGATDTFTVTTTNAGTAPSYMWRRNGSIVGTGTSYVSASLTNGDAITVGMVSNMPCVPLVAVYDTMNMTVLPIVTPTVTIVASKGNQICAGALDSFSVSNTNAGTVPAYVWKVNTTTVGTGSNFVSSALAHADVVSVTMTSSAACLSTPTATNAVTMTVFALPAAPAVTSTYFYCENALATPLTASGATGNTFRWYLTATGGTPFTSAPTPSTATADTTDFWVSQVTSNGCESPRSMITVYVLPTPPTPVATASSPVCLGDTLFLSASSTVTSPTYSWTGPGFSSATQNPFIANTTKSVAGMYFLTVTQSGCVSGIDTVTVTLSCLDSVWAGDANFDKLVDNRDALEIALTMGSTGPARSATSIVWTPAAAHDWPTLLPGSTTINRKHADCDGNGTVSFADTLAVTANYGQTHPKEYHEPANKTAGLPDLYFDHSGVTMEAGQTVTVPILLGNAVSPMTSFAGIAARIRINGVAPVYPPSITYTGSWLGTTANTLHFSQGINNSRIDWAYARTDQRNNSGYGTLAWLSFAIPQGSDGQLMRLYFDDVKLVDSNGAEITQYNVLDDTFTVTAPPNTGVRHAANPNFGLKLLPNPSFGPCHAQITLPVSGAYSLEIRDLSGKLIWKVSGQGVKGQQKISLPIEQVNTGVYLIHLHQTGQEMLTLRWMRG